MILQVMWEIFYLSDIIDLGGGFTLGCYGEGVLIGLDDAIST